MKNSRLAKAVLACGLAIACCAGLAACGGSGASGAVAATVNGTEIMEQTVTDQIQQIREQSGLEDEDQWGLFLAQNDMTPSSVREQIINTLTEQELIAQGATDLGITVEDSEVDEYIDSMKANYTDDEAWKTALEQAGFTEDSYRETIRESLVEQKVGDYFQDQSEASDEDYVTAAQTYAPYYDGSKRSSHILFSVEDTTDDAAIADATAQAQEVLGQINAGTLDFADAARQYSGDTGSAENGGDVGWDTLNSFVTEYTDALAELELGQVSEPVISQYGVHLIKVTDVFTAPEEITSLDQIPAEFQDNIKEMAVSVQANTAYTDWLDGLKESADIVINDMPSGLPYDLDMTKYQEQAAAEAEDDATAEDATTVTEQTEEAVADEAAAEEGAAENAEAAEAGEAAAEGTAQDAQQDPGAAGSSSQGQ